MWEFVPVMAASEASSYRVKFRRVEFLELVDAAKPRFIYRGGRTTSSPSTASSCTASSAGTATSARGS